MAIIINLSDAAPLNERSKGWARATGSKMKARAISYGLTGDKIRTVTGLRNGIIDKIGFRFPRSLVYSEKGAKRGYGGKKGSTWLRADGSYGKTNPASFGKMNTGLSKAKAWFNPTLQSEFPELQKIVAEEIGNATLRDIKRVLIQ